jgi:hypothetical protein
MKYVENRSQWKRNYQNPGLTCCLSIIICTGFCFDLLLLPDCQEGVRVQLVPGVVLGGGVVLLLKMRARLSGVL